MPTVHIEAEKEDIAPLILMPGDPLRAKYIAEKYLTNYKLVNKVRGELAFTGYYKGKLVTVFSSGMGIPSMGIYSYELFTEYNARVIIRIGSCGAYIPNLNLHDLILVTSSYSNSNYGKELLNQEVKEISSSEEVSKIIRATSEENNIKLIEGKVHSSDAFYSKEDIEIYKNLNCMATEMETFSLFINAKLTHKKASCLLTVSDSLVTKEEITREEREKSLDKMISLALESIIKL